MFDKVEAATKGTALARRRINPTLAAKSLPPLTTLKGIALCLAASRLRAKHLIWRKLRVGPQQHDATISVHTLPGTFMFSRASLSLCFLNSTPEKPPRFKNQDEITEVL